MVGDPLFSIHRSLPFGIFSILTKKTKKEKEKNLYVRSLKYFAFSALEGLKFSSNVDGHD